MRRALEIALLALCTLFVALAAWPWLAPEAKAPPRVAALPPAGGPVGDADLALPPLESFRATVERPLFSATRAPPPLRPAQDNAGELILGRYRLTGVMIAKEHTTVLLRPATGGKVIRLARGQEIDGWKVSAITPDQIVLTAGGKELRIPLGGVPRGPDSGRGGR